MTQRELAKTPPLRPAAEPDVTRRPEEERRPEWKPEVSKISRSELRRIVIEILG
jgi:hypothetical protein